LQVVLLGLRESLNLLDEAVLEVGVQEVKLVVFLHALLVSRCRTYLKVFESKDAVLRVFDLSRNGCNLFLDGHSSLLVRIFIEAD